MQVLPNLHGGGVERGTLEVARALVSAGHRSIVLSGGGRLVNELTAAGSEHIEWPIGKKSLATLRLIRPLRRLLHDLDVDILHLRSRLPAWIGWLAWRSMPLEQRPRLVTTVHGLHSPSWYSSVMTRGEQVIAVSESVRRYILEHYPACPDERIRVIHRGIDPSHFHPGFHPSAAWLSEWYRCHPETRGRWLVTLPGRITRLKGHADLLRIVRRVSDAGIDIHALIVGEPAAERTRYLTELHREADTLGISTRLSFTGHRDDLREIMALSDAVLSLSATAESFGRTALEALALGRPLLGYAHGGVGELLDSLLPEGRIAPGDHAAAADRLIQWSRFGAPEPKRDHPFTLEHMLEQTLELYQELL